MKLRFSLSNLCCLVLSISLILGWRSYLRTHTDHLSPLKDKVLAYHREQCRFRLAIARIDLSKADLSKPEIAKLAAEQGRRDKYGIPRDSLLLVDFNYAGQLYEISEHMLGNYTYRRGD